MQKKNYLQSIDDDIRVEHLQYKTTIQSSCSGRHVPEENRWIFQWNVFGIADAILIAGFDVWDKDHDEMLERVLQACQPAHS